MKFLRRQNDKATSLVNKLSFLLLYIFRGKGDYYRLGHGSDDHVRRPKRVVALQNKKVVAIATGSLHCVACTDTGEVYTWGDNDEGQLGDGSTSAIQRPRLVTALQVRYERKGFEMKRGSQFSPLPYNFFR